MKALIFTLGLSTLILALSSENNMIAKPIVEDGFIKRAKMDELESARLLSYKFSAFAAFNMEIEKELHDINKKTSSKVDKLHKEMQPLQFSALLSTLYSDTPTHQPTILNTNVPTAFPSSTSPSTTSPPVTTVPVCFLGAYCYTNGTNPCISGTYCSSATSPSVCLLDSSKDLTSSCTANHGDCSSQSTCCSNAFTCTPVGSSKICSRIIPPLCSLPQASLADEL